MCHRITCKGYERKRRIRGGKEKLKKKKKKKKNILLPTLMCGSEVWIWNRAQQPRVCVVQISYLKDACGVARWEVESDESVYERCSMGL